MNDPSKKQEGPVEETTEENEPELSSEAPTVFPSFVSSFGRPALPSRFSFTRQPSSLQHSFQIPGRAGASLSNCFSAAEPPPEGAEPSPDVMAGERPAARRAERLRTGDTWRQEPDQEILEMKNKDRLIIYKGCGWIMEDKNHNPITRTVIPSLNSSQDNCLYSLARGDKSLGVVHEFYGVMTIQFENGDKIVFDNHGVCSISRKKDSAFLREPIRKSGGPQPWKRS